MPAAQAEMNERCVNFMSGVARIELLLSPLLLQNGISMSCALRLFLIRMALQCTPENIQQMMMALKASFGLVDNDRKQVLQAHVKTF